MKIHRSNNDQEQYLREVSQRYENEVGEAHKQLIEMTQVEKPTPQLLRDKGFRLYRTEGKGMETVVVLAHLDQFVFGWHVELNHKLNVIKRTGLNDEDEWRDALKKIKGDDNNGIYTS